MEANCVADKLTDLLNTLQMSAIEKRVILEAISDLRAAYCSFCNRMLKTGDIVETQDKDAYNNDRQKCELCLDT
jgi:hypothetical protein